ncbi:hypothetical protein CTI12_AA398050 [Artemisia annua]|uniref:Uncharacterized protein n=1 Tax=Artemisia annua TaxID=35608 RepID=A0A2U1MBI8_ARTAN|nr:hypothetical protein CTI12_AA398050 [Artemisia annua]
MNQTSEHVVKEEIHLKTECTIKVTDEGKGDTVAEEMDLKIKSVKKKKLKHMENDGDNCNENEEGDKKGVVVKDKECRFDLSSLYRLWSVTVMLSSPHLGLREGENSSRIWDGRARIYEAPQKGFKLLDGTATPGDGFGVPHVAYREATTDATLNVCHYTLVGSNAQTSLVLDFGARIGHLLGPQVPHDLSTNYGSHQLQQVDTPAATATLQTFVPLGTTVGGQRPTAHRSRVCRGATTGVTFLHINVLCGSRCLWIYVQHMPTAGTSARSRILGKRKANDGLRGAQPASRRSLMVDGCASTLPQNMPRC